MNDMTPVRQAVHWHEGMLLSPQHFQQNNLYLEQNMFNQIRRLTPYYYGVTRLSIDLPTLAASKNQHIKIRYLHGVMPDGTEISYDENNEQGQDDSGLRLEYVLDNLDSVPAMEPFYVYATVVKKSEAGNDISSRLKRYDVIKKFKIADLHDNSNQIPLDQLSLRVTLMRDDESNRNYSRMPLLRFRKKFDGELERLPYTPPCLHVTSSVETTPVQSDIWYKIQQKLETLEKKANERREYFTGGSDLVPLSMMQKQEILYITQHLPAMSIMFNTGQCHPYDFYLALIKMTTSMSVLLNDGKYSQYKNYDHLNLDSIFAAPLTDLERVIKQVEQPYTIINFNQIEENAFQHEFRQLIKTPQVNLVFRLQPGVNKEQLTSWIQTAMICSPQMQEEIEKARTLGLVRDKVPAFAELDKSENSDELLYTVTLDEMGFSNSEQNQKLPTLLVCGTDANLSQYAPAAISLVRPRGESE